MITPKQKSTLEEDLMITSTPVIRNQTDICDEVRQEDFEGMPTLP